MNLLQLKQTIQVAQHRAVDWIIGHHPWIGLDRRAEELLDHFEGFIPRSAHVLDIGGGRGFYYEPLQRRKACQVTLLDIQRYQSCRAPVVCYDGSTFPFPDQSFDASLLITMLHHCERPLDVLREAKRVTRGTVIVIEDLFSSRIGKWWTTLRDTLYNLEFVGHPKQFFAAFAWRKLFDQLGFKVVKEEDFVTRLLGLSIRNGLFVLTSQV